MSHNFARRSAAALAAATLFASMLTGCGAKGLPMSSAAALAVPMFSDGAETEATSTLMQGFDKIHKAIFTKLDKDKNNAIDEYEAGPNLSLSDFQRADRDQDGKLTYGEFKKYAITNLFFFHDSPQGFTNRFRSQLGGVFHRLDTNHDGVLQKNETSLRDLKKLQLTFEYPRLNIKVKINKIDKDTFKNADKTGDGVLSQAEFEDLYINMVLIALGAPPAGDGPAEPDPGADPNAPADDPGTDPNAPDPGADPNAPPAPSGGDDPNAPPAPQPAPKKKSRR